MGRKKNKGIAKKNYSLKSWIIKIRIEKKSHEWR